ncbi:MAG: UDP-N-acetylmuramoyl-L-alanine--D-glutamate ligase [Actinobacteria bacterium]|nr:UDP-N-acetylmuramoyl-L-alanine--D-glutamate ligase [Actinomycetota bacterium]
MRHWLAAADGQSPWHEASVLVLGLGRSGVAAADAMLSRGASVVVVESATSTSLTEAGTMLEVLGATVLMGGDAPATLPEGTDLVITSPGARPSSPLLADAARRGVPVWGDVELAWRLQQPDQVVPWLAVTGTNGKTTTTQMLESILTAAGHLAAAVGNIGRPVLEAMADDVTYDVYAVELSSFQLHWTRSIALHSAAVLNLEQDHLEWYEDSADWSEHADPMAAYAADKARIYSGVTHSCVYNAEAPATERMVEEADVTEGARAIGFTTGVPAVSMLGVVDDLLVDRAFIPQRRDSAIELAKLSDVVPYAPHNVANALAAAALARSFGVPPGAVSAGLRALTIGGHRIQTLATVDGVTWVDDSKATNPHAADSSLRAFPHVVWVAGGQAKNTSFDDLVSRHKDRLRGAVLLGVDREHIRAALARHAPDVPVIVVDSVDDRAMDEVVRAARTLAQPGDTVLLAPWCASKDMYSGYDARGDAFAAAVRDLTAGMG